MKLIYWIITFIVFKISLFYFTKSPEIVEKYYSTGFYPYYSSVMNSITKTIPFSIGDVIYLLAILLIGYKLYKIVKFGENFKNKVIDVTILGVKFAIGFYILFNLSWGLNNYRLPLYVKLELQEGYNGEKLYNLTKKIIEETNKQQIILTNKNDIPVVNNFTNKNIYNDTAIGLKKTAIETDLYDYYDTTVKSSLYSVILTYMGFSGYINPFTNEAQVNRIIPKLTMIVTASHEASHQLGFARESEANFIGFLSAKNQDNLLYKYGANIFALRYCLNELAKNEPEYFEELKETIHQGVKTNINENMLFWQSYKNITDSFFKFFYSNFLKMNNQSEGLRSYNKFVDLLVNYDQEHPLY
ncbi:DUF3810 domain-containing protein [Myroides injenensis]|uniref:DUF3810 domain-containing protein n=1 Tax=Myroides injenensis TaxID=1183151 RepID=UPI000287AB33|nr:DUF3810 domain-containing protein [Myroides injenensis]